jgi:hypothetical protein
MIFRFQNLHHNRDRAKRYHRADEKGGCDSRKYVGTVFAQVSKGVFKASAASADSPGSAKSLFEMEFVCK